jgi:hypothetical protein
VGVGVVVMMMMMMVRMMMFWLSVCHDQSQLGREGPGHWPSEEVRSRVADLLLAAPFQHAQAELEKVGACGLDWTGGTASA